MVYTSNRENIMGKIIRLLGARGASSGGEPPLAVPAPSAAQWLINHNCAIQNPRGIERAIVSLRAGLLEYTIQYGESFEGCELRQNGVLGNA